jgi:hypothetical protein
LSLAPPYSLQTPCALLKITTSDLQVTEGCPADPRACRVTLTIKAAKTASAPTLDCVQVPLQCFLKIGQKVVTTSSAPESGFQKLVGSDACPRPTTQGELDGRQAGGRYRGHFRCDAKAPSGALEGTITKRLEPYTGAASRGRVCHHVSSCHLIVSSHRVISSCHRVIVSSRVITCHHVSSSERAQ